MSRYLTDPAAFIDDFMPLNEKGNAWRLSPHQRKVMALAFRWTAEGRLDLLRLLIWGESKKSGKTLLAAALGLWWAYTRPYTEVVCVANDLDQSIGRVFASMLALIKHNTPLQTSVVSSKTETIVLTNGTTIVAIASDYTGEAGRRHSLAIFDEPWGIMSERAQRLFEELTPPPTEPEAWLLMVTYAGFSGESKLLEGLYLQGLQGERIDDDLELYRAGGLTMFWSHTPRQPWQTAEYYAGQKQTLRANAYLRLHENRWVTGTEAFITGEEWDACVDTNLVPALVSSSTGHVIGVDVGIKHDRAAVVEVAWEYDRLVLKNHRIWKPTKEHPLDIELTIEAYLLERHRAGSLRAIVCDPYQLHRSITSLRREGLPIEELPQTQGNTISFGQSLFDAIKGGNLRMYPSPELREMALNAVALETGRGWRLAKEKSRNKIDAIVALAMAAHVAITVGNTEMFAYTIPVTGSAYSRGDQHPGYTPAQRQLLALMATFGHPEYESDPVTRDLKARGIVPMRPDVPVVRGH